MSKQILKKHYLKRIMSYKRHRDCGFVIVMGNFSQAPLLFKNEKKALYVCTLLH